MSEESNLVRHARDELARAGLFDIDSDYGGMLGDAALAIVTLFAEQGHSGMSAALTTDIATRLMQFQTLTPITSDPDEWMNVSDVSGVPMWQSKRDPSFFSTDGGSTWYSLNDAGANDE